MIMKSLNFTILDVNNKTFCLDDYEIIKKSNKLILAKDILNNDFIIFSGILTASEFKANRIFRSPVPLIAYINYNEYKQLQDIKSFCQFLANFGINAKSELSWVDFSLQ